MYVINPYTSRKIKVNGPTYKKLLKQGNFELLQYGGIDDSNKKPQKPQQKQQRVTKKQQKSPQKKQQKKQQGQQSTVSLDIPMDRSSKTAMGNHTNLKAVADIQGTTKSNHSDIFTKLLAKSTTNPKYLKTSVGTGHQPIPTSQSELMLSNIIPNSGSQSWVHYHEPFSQNIGEYVCLKRSTLRDLGRFLNLSLNSNIDFDHR